MAAWRGSRFALLCSKAASTHIVGNFVRDIGEIKATHSKPSEIVSTQTRRDCLPVAAIRAL